MLAEEVKIIDSIAEFKPIAQGNTAEVYLYDEKKILKLFRENMPIEPVAAEYDKVRCIQSELRNIPKAYEMIRYKERYGIIYDRIVGIDMINRMMKNVFGVKRYSKLLARIHFELHTTGSELKDSVKNKLGREIDEVSALSEDEKGKIKSLLQALPEGNALLHFDFHPGNIIMRDNVPIIIDWMTACVGDPCADVARTCLLLQYGELRHASWLVNKLVRLFENYIGKIYIDEYKRLSGISDGDFKRWLIPVAAGRLMEWISDNEKEQLLKLIRTNLPKSD